MVDHVPHLTQGNQQLISETLLNRFLWTHVAVTFHLQSGTARFFINGRECACSEGNWPPFAPNLANFSSRDAPPGVVFMAKNGAGNFLKGRLAEFRVWNTARKWYDVASKFNHPILADSSTPTPYPPHLIGYWPMNDGSGHTLRSQLPGGTDASKAGARWQ